MKRTMAIILCCIMFAMSPFSVQASDTADTLSGIETIYGSPSDVAISFLNDCATEMFMYESEELSNRTVLALSSNDLVTANEKFVSAFANKPASFDYWLSLIHI